MRARTTDALLDLVRVSPLYHPLRPLAERRELARWERAGRPAPVPHPVKRALVRDHARRFGRRVLVETGTYLATMLLEERRTFTRLHSIELDPRLFELARRRCKRFPEIHLLLGDSAVELPGLIDGLDEPALFWLDAHHAGRLTARGPRETPIEAELEAILTRVEEPVVLVDDAHLFTGRNGYPPLPALLERVRSQRPRLVAAVVTNVIVLAPAATCPASP